jgi:hypothetical protein
MKPGSLDRIAGPLSATRPTPTGGYLHVQHRDTSLRVRQVERLHGNDGLILLGCVNNLLADSQDKAGMAIRTFKRIAGMVENGAAAGAFNRTNDRILLGGHDGLPGVKIFPAL